VIFFISSRILAMALLQLFNQMEIIDFP